MTVKVCYITAYEIDYEKLRSTMGIGCVIEKPIAINDLVKKINAKLDHNK